MYRAYQENLDREVAIKVLPPWYAADRNFVGRFKLEARLVGRLSHPNIVTVHDASEYNGHLYIVMQLVDGGTLKQRLDFLREQGQTLSMIETKHTLQQIASALQYAHEQGIIHRDIKPVNVLMDRSLRPILSDFGIAKVLAGAQDLTRPGAGVGTPEYMSPEQCKGEPVDGRADIYALGVLLYEALTGRTPFIGDNYPALAHSHVYEEPPDPRRFNPSIPAAVRDVILMALKKYPQQRFQRASAMAEALERAVHGPAAMYDSGWMAARGMPSATLPLPATVLVYYCPQCRHANKAEMYFCTSCGFSLNRCPACRHINRVRDRFCTKCGRQIA